MSGYLRTLVSARNVTASEVYTEHAVVDHAPSNAALYNSQVAMHTPSRLPLHLTSVNSIRVPKAVSCAKLFDIVVAAPVESNAWVCGWGNKSCKGLRQKLTHYNADIPLALNTGVIIHVPALRIGIQLRGPQLGGDPYTVRPTEAALLAAEFFIQDGADLDFDRALYIPSPVIEWGAVRLTDLPAVPLRSGVVLRIYQPPHRERDLLTPWGIKGPRAYSVESPFLTEPPPIEPGQIPSPTQKKVHLIVNSVDVIALPGNEPLAVANIRIDADLETYSWKLSAQILNEASLNLVRPGTVYKELAVLINGHRFEFFIPAFSESKRVGIDGRLERVWSISGYSRSQYLGAPYAPKRTRSVGSVSAVQAATDELLGTGFTLDWDTALLPDWTLNNAAFSYQELTPLEVIKRLATAAGGVVMADSAADMIIVRPRFKVPAWSLLPADMDRSLHESQMLSVSAQREGSVRYNAVDVAGEREGVVLTVTRQGTAGDAPASDVVDPWLTEIAANTARGITELSASGDRISYQVELSIPETSAQPGLLLPGLTLAVLHDDSAQDFRGYVSGVSISAAGGGSAIVTQSVTLDRPIGWES